MRKNNVFFVLLSMALILALAACSTLSKFGIGSDTSTAQDQNQPPDMSDQPIEMKLAVGTLKLEGTDQAVTPDQARTLLVLWKAVKVMSSDGNTSPEEMSGLYAQIQEAMTAEQVQTIKEMSLNREDTQALMTDLGIEMPQGGPRMENISEDERATRVAQFQAEGGSGNGRGEMPGGGGFPGGEGASPGDFGGEMPGGASNGRGEQPNAQGTPPAMGSNRGPGGGMNSIFIEPLIKLLEQRAAE